MMIHPADCLCGIGAVFYPWEWRSHVVSLGTLDPSNWIVRKMIDRGDIVPVEP